MAFALFGICGVLAGVLTLRVASTTSSPLLVWLSFLTYFGIFFLLWGELLSGRWVAYSGSDMWVVSQIIMACFPIGLAYFVTQFSFARR